MKFSKLVFVAFLSTFFFISCTDDDNDNETPLGVYDNGTLILNEGGFGKGNASVSYLSDDLLTLQNNIFSLVNPIITLGDTAQDVGFYGDLAFIVLNGSNKIEVVNRYTLKAVATIRTDLKNPRYIAFSNGKGFVTNWGDGKNLTDDFIAVINLTSYTVSSTIPVIEGPEKIVAANNKLYVAHKGGFNFGKTISVINGASNTVTTNITVGDIPNSLEISNGSLYVMCGGIPSWTKVETAGSLVKLNLANNTVTSTLNFPEKTHPANFDIVDDNFFFTIGADVFKSTLSASALPVTKLFSTTPQGVYGVYGFAVHNNKVFVGDAGDYSSNGKVYIYSLTGVLEKESTVGIIPSGFYFN